MTEKYILSGPFLRCGIMFTQNNIGGCYMNQKHSEMPFHTLADMLLVIFSAECTIGMVWGVGLAKALWQ